MFGKTNNDIARTLSVMTEQAIQDCRFNQTEAVRKVAEFVKQDRRFDGYDPNFVAKRAFESRQTGRQLRLDTPEQTHSLPPTYTGR